MCRWITLISHESVSLSDVVLAPTNSLIQLSRDASFHPGYSLVNNAVINGDGFGCGWYHHNAAYYKPADVAHDGGLTATTVANSQAAPNSNNNNNSTAEENPNTPKGVVHAQAAIFKDIQPAWNNTNLRELCLATSSNCIMAHVRAASKGTGISQQNCHPFKGGRLLFCHNGRLHQFAQYRRKFLEHIADEVYSNIYGNTDSEIVFHLVLTNLMATADCPEHANPLHQKTPFGAKRLVAAIKRTLNQIEAFYESLGLGQTEGVYNTCNFSITDGDTMVVTRFCDKSPEIPPPSLYFAYGTASSLYRELTHDEAPPPPTPAFQSMDSEVTDDTESVDSGNTSSVGLEEDWAEKWAERRVGLLNSLSRPGKVMEQVNPVTASFIVASNPLTKTHTWHPMPRNSIMWCTRGKHPEMRKLIRRKSMANF